MHKKIILKDLDIPVDDAECWDKYPKYRWVYDTSRVLEAQSIEWSPMLKNVNFESLANYTLETALTYEPGIIYTKKIEGQHLLTEVYIVKGEIKFMRHLNEYHKEIEDLKGEIELRVNAFVTLYFQKFTGVISIDTYSNNIYKIRLRPISDNSIETNTEVIRLLKRIYKRTDLITNSTTTDVTCNGLADQANRVLVAS